MSPYWSKTAFQGVHPRKARLLFRTCTCTVSKSLLSIPKLSKLSALDFQCHRHDLPQSTFIQLPPPAPEHTWQCNYCPFWALPPCSPSGMHTHTRLPLPCPIRFDCTLSSFFWPHGQVCHLAARVHTYLQASLCSLWSLWTAREPRSWHKVLSD